MKATANRETYLDFLMEQFSLMGEISRRSMFGGHTLYCDGMPFALVASNAVYLKADGHNRPEFEARGLRPFRPFEKSTSVMQYYETPPEVFEDPNSLRHWAGGAIAAGQRARAKSTQARRPVPRKQKQKQKQK